MYMNEINSMIKVMTKSELQQLKSEVENLIESEMIKERETFSTIEVCPYCGSESVYETGGHYRCAECGSNIYSPDDLELGYWEGYMELLAPVSLTIN